MPSAHKWYDVCVALLSATAGIHDSAQGITLDSAKGHVAKFREMYPNAALIFVQLHFRKKGKPAIKILHQLTVNRGKTAAERRQAVMANGKGA